MFSSFACWQGSKFRLHRTSDSDERIFFANTLSVFSLKEDCFRARSFVAKQLLQRSPCTIRLWEVFLSQKVKNTQSEKKRELHPQEVSANLRTHSPETRSCCAEVSTAKLRLQSSSRLDDLKGGHLLPQAGLSILSEKKKSLEIGQKIYQLST